MDKVSEDKTALNEPGLVADKLAKAVDASGEETNADVLDLLSKLKRYDLHQHHPCGQKQYGIMQVHEDGEYVEYDEAERLFKRLAATISRLEKTVDDLRTQISLDDQNDAEAKNQTKALEDDINKMASALKLNRNALKRARTYVEMIVTDQHFTTETEKEDLELIDLVLGISCDPIQK